MRLSTCVTVVLLSAIACSAQADEPAKQKPSGHRVLMVTQSKGFVHGSVKRKDSELAPAERAVTDIGIRSNLFRTDCTQDCERDFTKENLKNYDIVFFYTTGDLPIKQADRDYFFNEWLKQKGHGFVGAHSAADTYHNYQPYWDMIGGTFNGHPWGAGDTVTITVHDKNHPASRPWGSEFSIKDEIYRFKNWQPEKVRVLMSLNMAKTPSKLDEQLKRQADDLTKKGKADDGKRLLEQIGKRPYHVPILWVKKYGDGKVMHMSLGHNENIWTNETYQASLLGGIRWILNLEPGDATPNPELSAAQEKKARADVAAKK